MVQKVRDAYKNGIILFTVGIILFVTSCCWCGYADDEHEEEEASQADERTTRPLTRTVMRTRRMLRTRSWTLS